MFCSTLSILKNHKYSLYTLSTVSVIDKIQSVVYNNGKSWYRVFTYFYCVTIKVKLL